MFYNTQDASKIDGVPHAVEFVQFASMAEFVMMWVVCVFARLDSAVIFVKLVSFLEFHGICIILIYINRVQGEYRDLKY